MGSTAERWGKLTRADLAAYDDLATSIVLAAMDLGGVGRISKRGHAILRAKTGETMSVSPTLGAGNRGAQNARAQFRRTFGKSLDEVKAMPSEKKPQPKATPEAAQVTREKLTCPAPRCEYYAFAPGAIYAHVHSAHKFVCPEPGCVWACDSPQGLRGHQRIVHEGFKPALGRGKKQKTTPPPVATSARKQVITAEPETEQMTETDTGLDALEAGMKAETKIVLNKPETAEDMIALVRLIIGSAGPTEREKELEAALTEVTEQRDELQAKLELLRETLQQLGE